MFAATFEKKKKRTKWIFWLFSKVSIITYMESNNLVTTSEPAFNISKGNLISSLIRKRSFLLQMTLFTDILCRLTVSSSAFFFFFCFSLLLALFASVFFSFLLFFFRALNNLANFSLAKTRFCKQVRYLEDEGKLLLCVFVGTKQQELRYM